MAAMNCRECRDELELWVGQADLPREIAEHIAGCAECRTYRDELRALAGSVAEDREFDATKAERAMIEAGIKRRLNPDKATVITPLHWLRYAAMAASVIIVAGIGITGYRANWFGHRAGVVDTTAVALADSQTQNRSEIDSTAILDDQDYSALEQAIDQSTQLDDATVLDSLSDEQIKYLESHLDVKGLI
ncbi:hypothetical protein C3F09_04805 [candidate division GN15 bacterium]|uniref:Zinc-finger domain-containing protein n=1 Tax=candidate division GN15 bacterium TaxID=2072418 RepID=A0A855X7K3_9BACT|nr:MAG: hypothetical protein C3F09_04805 [candidate division GN15 bacterium]